MNKQINKGDRVHQVALVGLAAIPNDPYVVGVYPDGIEISSEPDGEPRTDINNQPRHYPPHKFLRIS